MVTKTPKHVLKKIESIVRQLVEERFGDGFVFEPIMALAHEDPFGDESVYIYVVYEGNPDKLDPAWTVTLSRRVLEHLTEEELDTFPYKHFIPKSEWKEVYRYNVAPWIPATS